MTRIKVAKVQTSAKKQSKRELYATVCYYYKYELEYVQQLPARDLILLVKQAQKREAANYYNLTSIMAAPHSKNMSQVKKLLNHFGNLAKD